MQNTGFSSLAHQLNNRIHASSDRTAEIFGVVVHQTGEDIVEQALKHGANPLEYVAEFYLDPENYFPHYVIGHDGQIIQIAPESEKALHVGFDPEDRKAFLFGTWEQKLTPQVVAAWKQKWPNFASPANLFPGPSVNNVFIGIEMLPIVDSCGFEAASWLKNGKFTTAQHNAIVALLQDIGHRNLLPVGWHLANRLVGHEDVNPLRRTTKNLFWDPGALNPDPWFDFQWVRIKIQQAICKPQY